MADTEKLQSKLDELGEHIEDAKRNANDALGEPQPEEPMYFESGEVRGEDDDQTIAPPG